MKRTFFVTFVSLNLLLLPLAAVAETEASNDLLAKVDSYRAYDSSAFSYDFETTEDDGQKSLMRVSVRLGATEAALVKYLEPLKERGRAVLVRGNAFWLYEPGMKSSIRISPRQLLFGQASAGDVSRISFSAMYDIVSTEEVADGFKLRLKAKPKAGATYDLVDLTTDTERRPLVAECRGSSGTLMKTLRYDGYETIEGKLLLVSFTIRDEIGGKTTRVRIGNYNVTVPPESTYSVQALKNYR